MPSFLKVALLVLRKDFAIEVKSLEIFSTTLFFAVTCVLIFSFAFVNESGEAINTAMVPAAILWIAVAFGGMQGVELRDLEELLERGREPASLVRVDRLAGGGEAARARRILDRPIPRGPAKAPQERPDRAGILPGHGLELLPRHGLAR